MKFVYQLSARGMDWMTGNSVRTVQTRTVFASPEIAESRIEKFRKALVEKNMMLAPEDGGVEIEITMQQLEVIDEL